MVAETHEGALGRVDGYVRRVAELALRYLAEAVSDERDLDRFSDAYLVNVWNDTPGQTQAEVLTGFDRAIARARADEAELTAKIEKLTAEADRLEASA